MLKPVYGIERNGRRIFRFAIENFKGGFKSRRIQFGDFKRLFVYGFSKVETKTRMMDGVVRKTTEKFLGITIVNQESIDAIFLVSLRILANSRQCDDFTWTSEEPVRIGAKSRWNHQLMESKHLEDPKNGLLKNEILAFEISLTDIPNNEIPSSCQPNAVTISGHEEAAHFEAGNSIFKVFYRDLRRFPDSVLARCAAVQDKDMRPIHVETDAWYFEEIVEYMKDPKSFVPENLGYHFTNELRFYGERLRLESLVEACEDFLSSDLNRTKTIETIFDSRLLIDRLWETKMSVIIVNSDDISMTDPSFRRLYNYVDARKYKIYFHQDISRVFFQDFSVCLFDPKLKVCLGSIKYNTRMKDEIALKLLEFLLYANLHIPFP